VVDFAAMIYADNFFLIHLFDVFQAVPLMSLKFYQLSMGSLAAQHVNK
jgi:hypothetical protein